MANTTAEQPLVAGAFQPRPCRARQIRRSKEASSVRLAALAVSPDLLPRGAEQVRAATSRQLRRTRQAATRAIVIDIDIDIDIVIKVARARAAQARQFVRAASTRLEIPKASDDRRL